jgi:hypothetical protein
VCSRLCEIGDPKEFEANPIAINEATSKDVNIKKFSGSNLFGAFNVSATKDADAADIESHGIITNTSSSELRPRDSSVSLELSGELAKQKKGCEPSPAVSPP